MNFGASENVLFAFLELLLFYAVSIINTLTRLTIWNKEHHRNETHNNVFFRFAWIVFHHFTTPRKKVFWVINNKYFPQHQTKKPDIYSTVQDRICFYGPRISSKPRELYSLQWLLGDISFIIVHSSFMCFRRLLEARQGHYRNRLCMGMNLKGLLRPRKKLLHIYKQLHRAVQKWKNYITLEKIISIHQVWIQHVITLLSPDKEANSDPQH